MRFSWIGAAAAALGVVLAIAPATEAQERPGTSPRPEAALAGAERLAYDVSLAMAWTIEEVRDPLQVEGRLELELPPEWAAGGTAGLRGRLALKSCVYQGPTGNWRLSPGDGLKDARVISLVRRIARPPGKLDAASRTLLRLYGGETEAGEYPLAVARAEELLGCGLIALRGNGFRAERSRDGRVSVAPPGADAFVPGTPAAAQEAVRAGLGELVRFVLDRSAVKTRRTETAPGAPFTLAAVLGARYEPDVTREKDRPLDLAVSGYRADVLDDAVYAKRGGRLASRRLGLLESLRASSPDGRAIRVETQLRWEAKAVR